MSQRPRRILLLIGGAAGLLLLTALTVLLVVNLDHYKARFEKAASNALGMDVRIGGRLGIGVFPGLHLRMGELQILDEHAAAVASAKRTTLWVALLPLIRGEFRVRRVELRQPVFSIARSPDGKVHVEWLREAIAALDGPEGARVSLSDGILRYADRKSGAAIEFTGLDLNVSRVHFAGGSSPQPWKALSLEADLACGSIRTKDLSASAVKASVHAKDGVLEFEPVTLRVFSGQATGSLRVDDSGPVRLSQIRCSLPRFRIEEFIEVLSSNVAMKGTMAFSASLAMRGTTMSQMVQTAEGELTLQGRNLTLVGSDLDQALSRFASSQRFNLVDVGAIFFVGPLGLAVTKGYNFASLFAGSEGTSSIGTLVSIWKVERGVAGAKDVAMTTAKNRIALRGGLDFVDQQFDDVTVAVINAQGCAMARQAIRGSFEDPVLEKPHVLKSLAGPVLKMYKQARRLFPSGPCEPFYSGSVAPPKEE